MLTRLVVRNFKTLEDADIELGQTVVFIGPAKIDPEVTVVLDRITEILRWSP